MTMSNSPAANWSLKTDVVSEALALMVSRRTMSSGSKRVRDKRYRYAKQKLGRTNSGRSYIVKKSTYD